MDYLPIFFKAENRQVLVVGGGGVGARKIALLLEANALVHVIAPDICDEVAQWEADEKLCISRREVRTDDIKDIALVICATDNMQVNQHVAATAQGQNIPVNVVDNPKLCTFIMPSIIDRSPVMLAISTGGTSPVLARLLRTKLESFIPAKLGNVAKYAFKVRDKVKAKVKPEDRRYFWETMLQGTVSESIIAGKTEEAESAFNKLLANHSDSGIGEVYLIGGGPGDPDLLTFRALRLMQQADIVLYDRLVSPQVLNLVRRDAERIYVGKKRDQHTLSQDKINAELIRYAKQGKRVLRLKGGDPFIFGRGGEEIEQLMSEGIPFQVVPGITAAAGCAAYSGIPLTHRDHAQSVLFVTGHLKDGGVTLPWDQMVQKNQTVVIYMGLHGLPVIVDKLLEHGAARELPAAIIERGTTESHKTHITTLAELPSLPEKANIKPPSLVILGSVVNLSQKLQWFQPDKIESTNLTDQTQ